MPFVDLVGNGRLGIPDGSERAVMSLFPERVPFGDVAFRALAGQVCIDRVFHIRSHG